jgi:hypothetical protein
LRFFDLRINALALHLRSRELLDPFEVLANSRPVDPGINWSRWSEMSPLELTVLAIRLVRIMYEAPWLTISAVDADRLRKEVMPRIGECDWTAVHQRFPPGRDRFLRCFETGVLMRSRPLGP